MYGLPGEEKSSMLQIRWHGHACWEITNDITLVTDPHDGKSIGIPAPSVQGDIVFIRRDIQQLPVRIRQEIKIVDKRPVAGVRRFVVFFTDVAYARQGADICFIVQMLLCCSSFSFRMRIKLPRGDQSQHFIPANVRSNSILLVIPSDIFPIKNFF